MDLRGVGFESLYFFWQDCEIDGLNEQLEEDCKAMERLQLQLQQERAKRLDAERENVWLHDQVCMLMNMLCINKDERHYIMNHYTMGQGLEGKIDMHLV